MSIRAISYGGGVQSTAMVVLAATRDPDFEGVMGGPVDAALFANVGDDSEHPASIAFVRDVATPWAAAKGLPVIELHRVRRDGTVVTLRQDVEGPNKTINIPIRMDNGAPGNRNCTSTYKIKVISKWLREAGATPDTPATVAIGISTDEAERAHNRRPEPRELPVYPLLEMGISRAQCQQIIADAGLPVPGKSSCFFCPFQKPQRWSEMRRDEPMLFWQAVEIERRVNEKRGTLGRDNVFLTRFAKPLDQAISEAQDQLPGLESIGEAGCDSGYCWT